ncbi:monosaccharide ABC transporter membrane protein, CUT2 family (TC 3.A.1.2.-) [Propionispira arboris]|uniref:Monosaccharide ABC transporter membrane protein, CUT2 family (TC 3.A.1.2.-) n=1 Tax=Propionispira arboris TaxID=84035 RepID=A0A1H6YS53_9FIRM|nr:ABC transporter permease [Propionispira arboris]SEJ43206.1 monosaccharide ABC transporter membrane protein, CUT2 family (TC 3.A.1.2.-) [Propionispira arboris]
MERNNVVRWLLNYGIILILCLLVISFSFATANFMKLSTIFTILKQVSIIGIISVGMTYVMLTGGIDLSVGSIAGVSAVTAAILMMHGVPIVPACIIVLLISLLYGAISGFFITHFNIPALIVTLGVMTSLRGLAYIVTDGMPVFGFNDNFGSFANSTLWLLPYPVILAAAVFIIAFISLEKTCMGRYLYGVGGNEEASRLSGVNVVRIKYFAYAVSGLLSGLAGLVLLSRTNSGQPAAGLGYEMDAITAVVLAGVNIMGGEGRIGMVVIGVLIMGVLGTGMIMCNINDYVQQFVKGIVLIGAVAFSAYSKTMRSRMMNK